MNKFTKCMTWVKGFASGIAVLLWIASLLAAFIGGGKTVDKMLSMACGDDWFVKLKKVVKENKEDEEA